jgi:Uma2 family endonuclease
MVYCFNGRDHGRKPDVVYVKLDRLPNREIPDGDILVAPDVAVEVLSPGNAGLEVDDKLDEYLAAGVALVWIVNPDRRTIRVYRQDGTTRSFRAAEVIENEPVLPGFRLVVGEVFPAAPAAA